MAWPLYDASSAHLGAEQRGTKVVGALEVCSKALQQRDAWDVRQPLLDATFRVSRILLDCIHGLLMGVTGNVIGLSSIKIGDPASSEGT
jgi:hypothetical protein